MKSIFDITRFGNLLKRDFILSKRSILYMLGIVVGGYAIGIIFYFLFEVSFAPALFFFLGVFLFFSPNFLEKNMTKYNAVFDFTFPVSTFERLLALFVKHVLFLPLLFLLCIFLLNTLVGILPFPATKIFAEDMSLGWISWEAFTAFVTTQSIFLVGYLSFRNFSFVKTWLVIIVVNIVLGIFLGILSVTIFDGFGNNLFEIIDYAFEKSSYLRETAFGRGLDKVLHVLVMSLIPVGMWVTAFFKLREKEI